MRWCCVACDWLGLLERKNFILVEMHGKTAIKNIYLCIHRNNNIKIRLHRFETFKAD
jgi:hypothetical protein